METLNAQFILQYCWYYSYMYSITDEDSEYRPDANMAAAN